MASPPHVNEEGPAHSQRSRKSLLNARRAIRVGASAFTNQPHTNLFLGTANAVQARVKRDAAFRKGLLSEAIESLLSGEVTLGKELLRDYINATVGFPKLGAHTKIHVRTLHQMFGPNGNPTASNLFEIVAYLQQAEGVRFKIRSTRAA